jgi:hypothetical protein
MALRSAGVAAKTKPRVQAAGERDQQVHAPESKARSAWIEVLGGTMGGVASLP